MWQHFTNQEMMILYQPGDDDALPNHLSSWNIHEYTWRQLSLSSLLTHKHIIMFYNSAELCKSHTDQSDFCNGFVA